MLGVLASCNKDDSSEKLANEDRKLDEYIQANYPDAKELTNSVPNGLYIIASDTEQPKPEPGQYVLVDFILRQLFEDKVERVSYQDYESYQPIYYPFYIYGGPELWQLSAPSLTGVYKGLGLIGEGETGSIFFSSRHNMLFPSGADFISRVLEVKIVKIIEDLTLYQESLMNSYLSKYGTVDTLVTKSTVDSKEYKVMFSVIDKGSGDSIESPRVKVKINVYYTMLDGVQHTYLKDGETTWNSESSQFFNAAPNIMKEIFLKMNKGGRVSIAMPYRVYYGEDYNEILYDGNTGQRIIPHGSVIILDAIIE
jgi:hypothetical protein